MTQTAVRGADGMYLASSFGADQTTFGPSFRARDIANSERYRLIDRRQQYYSCTHHDWKEFDFDGRSIPRGNPLMGQPNLASEPADWYVPLRMRRPSTPYRLARVIVDSFTNLVFGHQRWPTIRSPGDPATEQFIRALADASHLRTTMIRARTLGGACGTVGLSWRFWKGQPRNLVHNAKNLFVHRWADREMLIPEHVTEMYRYPRDEWDQQRKMFVRKWYWFRRDWTPMADIVFHEIEYQADQDPYWRVDEERTYVHNDGFIHFVWVPNFPAENPEEIDGIPDYEGLYENFESLDLLSSVLARGTTLNLDPTLVLKMDPDLVNRAGIAKGSDNSLLVGETGDAHYMELGGSATNTGLSLLSKMRETSLEVAQCIVPDPNQIGAQGTSSVALKVIYAPMLSRADILREQYEKALRELQQQQLRSARKLLEAVHIDVDDEGNERERRFYLELPPVFRSMEIHDEQGNPTGEKREEREDLAPGPSNDLTYDWGDYFMPTAQDQQQVGQTLTGMVTGKLISQESGADLASRVLRIDPRADWDRIKQEKKAEEAAGAGADQSFGAFGRGGMGGAVRDRNELPPGALPRKRFGEGATGARAPVSGAKGVVTVNEARSAMGLEPLANPQGSMTLAEFEAKHRAAERVAVEGAKSELRAEAERRNREEAEQDGSRQPR